MQQNLELFTSHGRGLTSTTACTEIVSKLSFMDKYYYYFHKPGIVAYLYFPYM